MSQQSAKLRLRSEMRRLRATLADRSKRSRSICLHARQWLEQHLGRPATTRPGDDHGAAGRDGPDAARSPGCDMVGSGEATPRRRTIACFVGVRTEVATDDLLQWLLRHDDFRLAVPKTLSDTLAMYRVDRLSELAPGRFGIPEPRGDILEQAERRVPTAQLDAIFVPGLAFDPRGFRLGYGGGFFDRLLSEKPDHVPAIGLAFDCQLVATCPVEPHDLAVDVLITETRVIHCRNFAR